ncbi:MAG: hypothetical protein ABEI39_03780 [Halobacteriales archaeon]
MSEIRGRRLFALLAPVVVASAGGVGALVGAHAAARADRVAVLGLVALPASPAALGLAAALWAGAVLGVLYGLVALAARRDDAAV